MVQSYEAAAAAAAAVAAGRKQPACLSTRVNDRCKCWRLITLIYCNNR